MTGSNDYSPLRLWETVTGREVLTLLGHKAVTGVAFSPDGQLVYSSGRDGQIRIWNGTPVP